MRLLVTGVSGYVGAALVPRLQAAGHEVRGFARSQERVAAAGVLLDDVVLGDAISGAGLGRALDGVDAAYYLIHSMEGAADSGFPDARAAGGRALRHRGHGRRRARGSSTSAGCVPQEGVASRHLASRVAVERALLETAAEPIAFRASIVIGARSRSFRFLVRLIERLPVLALPAWRTNRTQPIDGRDVLDFLVARRRRARRARRPLVGPRRARTSMTYQELIARIAEHMLVDRPAIPLGFSLTPVASVVAAAVADEDPGFITPLMESLETDLLPRHDDAAECVRR